MKSGVELDGKQFGKMQKEHDSFASIGFILDVRELSEIFSWLIVDIVDMVFAGLHLLASWLIPNVLRYNNF